MIDPFKELVIDAICGAGFANQEMAMRYERQGFANFNGNQLKTGWIWNRESLGQLSTPGLQEIYQSIKERQMLIRQASDAIAKAASTL